LDKLAKKRKVIDSALAEMCFKVMEGMERPVVIDVGANRGLFLKACLKRNGNAKIIAVEPIEQNIKAIKNDLPDANMTAIEGVAWSGSGLAELFFSSGGTKDASLYEKSVKKYGTKIHSKIKVRTFTIDEIMNIAVVSHIDIMFMNCEGAEYELLLKNTDWLRKVSYLYLHLHTKTDEFLSEIYLKKREEIVGRLSDYGFRMIHGMTDLTFEAHIVQLWRRV